MQRRCLQIVLGCRSKSYNSNMVELGLTTLSERRDELVRSFAISCFRSCEHRWWFSPHPPLPLNTRHSPPRFLIPVSKRDRDLKRPIVRYTEILNGLTEEEWSKLKLPSPADVVHRPNLQLPDLVDPLHRSQHVLAPSKTVPNTVTFASKSQIGNLGCGGNEAVLGHGDAGADASGSGVEMVSHLEGGQVVGVGGRVLACNTHFQRT